MTLLRFHYSYDDGDNDLVFSVIASCDSGFVSDEIRQEIADNIANLRKERDTDDPDDYWEEARHVIEEALSMIDNFTYDILDDQCDFFIQ